MLSFKKRFLDENNGRKSLFTKLIEKLLGTQLTSHPLYIVDSIGTNIKSSLMTFTFILLSQIFIFPLLNLSKNFLDSLLFAVYFAGGLLIVAVAADLLFLIIPIWYEKIFKGKQSRQFVFIAILGAAALGFCLYTSIYHLSTPSKVKLVSETSRFKQILKV